MKTVVNQNRMGTTNYFTKKLKNHEKNQQKIIVTIQIFYNSFRNPEYLFFAGYLNHLFLAYPLPSHSSKP